MAGTQMLLTPPTKKTKSNTRAPRTVRTFANKLHHSMRGTLNGAPYFMLSCSQGHFIVRESEVRAVFVHKRDGVVVVVYKDNTSVTLKDVDYRKELDGS